MAEVNIFAALANYTEIPFHGSNEQVFHTSIINDKHVTKRSGIDATNEDERSLLEFDEMLNVDTIYRGLLYPIDQVSTKIPTKETSTKELMGKETLGLEAKKQTEVPDGLANAEKPLPKSLMPEAEVFDTTDHTEPQLDAPMTKNEVSETSKDA